MIGRMKWITEMRERKKRRDIRQEKKIFSFGRLITERY